MSPHQTIRTFVPLLVAVCRTPKSRQQPAAATIYYESKRSKPAGSRAPAETIPIDLVQGGGCPTMRLPLASMFVAAPALASLIAILGYLDPITTSPLIMHRFFSSWAHVLFNWVHPYLTQPNCLGQSK